MNKASRSAEQLKLRGNEHFNKGQYKEAHDIFSKALSESQTAVLFTNRALAACKLGRFEDALADAEAALGVSDGGEEVCWSTYHRIRLARPHGAQGVCKSRTGARRIE